MFLPLDQFEFLFEAVYQGLFFFDLIFGLFDDVSRGFVYLIWIKHAIIKGIELAANREDALGESIAIICYDLGWNV